MAGQLMTTHVHRRPGGAVFDEACACPDPSAWPVPEVSVHQVETVEFTGTSQQTPAEPEWVTPAPPPPPSVVPLRAEHAGTLPGIARLRRAVGKVARVAAGVPPRLRPWLRAGLRRGAARVVTGLRTSTRLVAATALYAVRFLAGIVRVIAAVIVGLGNGAQVAGVGIATWAAWELEPVAGKMVLAAGLLFLGGAVGRLVREVRNGSR